MSDYEDFRTEITMHAPEARTVVQHVLGPVPFVLVQAGMSEDGTPTIGFEAGGGLPQDPTVLAELLEHVASGLRQVAAGEGRPEQTPAAQ